MVTLPVQFPKVQMQYPEHPKGEISRDVQGRLKERLPQGEKEGLLEPDVCLEWHPKLSILFSLDNRKSKSERVKKKNRQSCKNGFHILYAKVYIYDRRRVLQTSRFRGICLLFPPLLLNKSGKDTLNVSVACGDGAIFLNTQRVVSLFTSNIKKWYQ